MTPQIEPADLTLEQKASLLSGLDFWHTKPIEDAGVPSILLTDGPHGLRYQDSETDHLGVHDSVPATCFPPAVAIGSSWDPEVAARVGAAIGREARAAGVSVVLGPGVNIKRSPLCGRNFEYYSEDPLLSGVLATAYVGVGPEYARNLPRPPVAAGQRGGIRSAGSQYRPSRPRPGIGWSNRVGSASTQW